VFQEPLKAWRYQACLAHTLTRPSCPTWHSNSIPTHPKRDNALELERTGSARRVGSAVGPPAGEATGSVSAPVQLVCFFCRRRDGSESGGGSGRAQGACWLAGSPGKRGAGNGRPSLLLGAGTVSGSRLARESRETGGRLHSTCNVADQTRYGASQRRHDKHLTLGRGASRCEVRDCLLPTAADHETQCARRASGEISSAALSIRIFRGAAAAAAVDSGGRWTAVRRAWAWRWLVTSQGVAAGQQQRTQQNRRPPNAWPVLVFKVVWSDGGMRSRPPRRQFDSQFFFGGCWGGQP